MQLIEKRGESRKQRPSPLRRGTRFGLMASGLLALGLALASPAAAWVLTGQITVDDPAPSSLLPGLAESNDIQVFQESQDVTLPVALGVNLYDTLFGGPPYTFTGPNPLLRMLPAGTRVNSYFIHFDPVGAPASLVGADGSITFGSPILGLITGSGQLAQSSAVVGVGGTNYGPPNGPSATTGDTVQISADGRTLTLHLAETNSIDQIRVLTAANTAPVVTSTVARSVLSPPNHDLVNVGLQAQVQDDFDTDLVPDVTVYSNEDDEEATGDGNFSPDAKLSDAGLRLRSERNGKGPGRVYLIVVSATDAGGLTGFTCRTVVVPQNQSPAALAAVQALAAQASAYCSAHQGQPLPGFEIVGDGAAAGPKQ